MPDDIKAAQTTEAEAAHAEEKEVVEPADSDTSEAEFTDSEAESESDGKGEDSKTTEPAKPWKNDANAEHARQRREAERQAEIKKARTEAIIDALGGVNPYTGDKIEDEADVEEYLTMKEIEKAGKDPIADYSRHVKAKAKEQEKATQEKSSKEDWFANDGKEFAAKHPDIKIDTLLADEMFRTFSDGKVGTVPMVKIYADYQAFQKKAEERAKQKAAQILANKTASPGKMSAEGTGDEFFTRDQVKAMSREEVSKNFDKIQTSMKKWN